VITNRLPLKLCWPSGGMGNTLNVIFNLGTEELSQYQTIDYLSFNNNGEHWHNISNRICSENVIRIHPEVVDDAIHIGSKNFYFVILLSWAKWAGFPNVNNYGEELENLHLFLIEWKPSITNPDFEITEFFKPTALAYVSNFIKSVGLTPNKNVKNIIKKVVENNERYYNKIMYLQSIAETVIEKSHSNIQFMQLYEQALLMTMIYHKLHIPFKLVWSAFQDTTSVWKRIELEN